MMQQPLSFKSQIHHFNLNWWKAIFATILAVRSVVVIHVPCYPVSYAFSTTATTSTIVRNRYQEYDDTTGGSYANRYLRLPPRQTLLLSLSSSNEDTMIELPTSGHSNNDDDNTARVKHLPRLNHKSEIIKKHILRLMTTTNQYDPKEMKDSYGSVEMVAYQLFRSLRDLHAALSSPDDQKGIFQEIPSPALFGMKGHPFVLRRSELEHALQQPSGFVDFFTMNDLQQALEDDFLDAARGSTDPRTGWKITDVSIPRGESFDEARMTYSDVCDALEKGTVIFNAAGAHIPKLAPICLAACDATSLPCALNMYITAAGKRISAPPHTDKQDVCIIQTQGCKAWKVFAIPDPSIKPNSDIFARGKGEDNLPLHTLKETSELLLDTTIFPGDVLFIPAGFPHTTSTVASTNNVDNDIVVDNNKNSGDRSETSVHMTLGIDHHIWELDYLSVLRLAYRRDGRLHNPLWDNVNDAISNPFVGKINMLSLHKLEKIMEELPLGLLEAGDTSIVDIIVKKTSDILSEIDPDCEIDTNTIKETVERIRQQGIELLNIHCDMYIAAIQEGRTREAENAMTAHLGVEAIKAKTLSADRIQRLSLFRVKKYYDLINDSIERLKIWSLARDKPAMNVDSTNVTPIVSDATMSKMISIGEKVEAELGGAFFPATVTRISDDGLYDVTFFDGDKEAGLGEAQIRLLSVPKSSPIIDTSKMTAKQLKRWKKEQEQSQK